MSEQESTAKSDADVLQVNRPRVPLALYMCSAVGVVLLLFGIFVKENYFDEWWEGKPQRATPSAFSIWFPIASIPISFIVAYGLFRRHSEVARCGVVVMAEVTEIGTFEHSGLRHLSFCYQYKGSRRDKKKSMPASTVDRLRVGEQFPVIVHPDNIDRYLIVNQFPPAAK